MEECGVTHDTNHSCIFALLFESFRSAMTCGESCTHTYAGINCVVRFRKAQCVTADITCYHDILSLAQFIEETSMGTSCTQCGGSGNNFCFVIINGFKFFAMNTSANYIGCQFVISEECIFAFWFKAKSLYFCFDQRIIFFDYIDRI